MLFIASVKIRSTIPIKTETNNVTTIVTMVEPISSCLVGQVTLVSSALTSLRDFIILPNIFFLFSTSGRPGGIRTPNIRFWRPAL